MKKSNFVKAGIALLAVLILAAVFAGCPAEETENGGALLTKITVAGIDPSQIPVPITQGEWEDEFFYPGDLSAEFTGNVWFYDRTKLNDAKVAVTVSSGAAVRYGIGFGYEKPHEGFPFKKNDTLDLPPSGYLYVEVTSGNGKTVNYYRFLMYIVNEGTQLSTITVGGVTATGNGTPMENWNQITVPGLVSLSNTTKNDAEVIVTPFSTGPTFRYAKATGNNEPQFGDNNTFNFADKDWLYIEVTAENGTNRIIYKFEIAIGRDATLKSVIIGDTEASNLGTPAPAANNPALEPGSYQADARQPAGVGFTVEVEANDPEAVVTWAHVVGAATNPAANAYGTASPIFFTSSSFLVVRVVSSGGGVTNFYKFEIILKSATDIYFGTPVIKDSSEKYIDPVWNDEAWLDVNRFNTAEPVSAFFRTDPHTTARAKALWDDDGLWVYWDIDYMDYQQPVGTQRIRTTVRSEPANSPNMSGAHERDSVELFINERLQEYKQGNYGNQFRVSADNNWLTGDAGTPVSGNAPITNFQNLKKTSAWVKMDGEKEIGYVVIMQGQWEYKTNDNATNVFDASGKVKDGAEIGMELQVNACAIRTVGASSGRDAVLTWNGITTQAYQNVRSFGIVTLKKNR